jgi:hypothetical protein
VCVCVRACVRACGGVCSLLCARANLTVVHCRQRRAQSADTRVHEGGAGDVSRVRDLWCCLLCVCCVLRENDAVWLRSDTMAYAAMKEMEREDATGVCACASACVCLTSLSHAPPRRPALSWQEACERAARARQR